MRGGVGENLGEYESEDRQHDQGVQQRPEHAQRHVAVADPKILEDQIFQQKPVIAMPHLWTLQKAKSSCEQTPAPTVSTCEGKRYDYTRSLATPQGLFRVDR